MNTDLVNFSKEISGKFCIKNPRLLKTQNNDSYFIFKIKLDLLPVTVVAWKKSCPGLTNLWHGQTVFINGRWEKFSGNWQIHCHSIRAEKQYLEDIELAKVRLRTIFSWLREETLKQFLFRIFNDVAVIDDFSSAPASLSHHHAYMGGLLVHSVDVAWKLFSLYHLPARERFLGVVAGLFHDLGKIRTLTKEKTITQIGSVISHEQLTLEILSPHLRWLDEHDIELSNSLRSLLTWKPRTYDPIPVLDVYEALKAADRMSAASSV